MTKEEAIDFLKSEREATRQLSNACNSDNTDYFKKHEEAYDIAINSLEAWEKVREDLRKFIDANSNSGDMYLDGRADGGWRALATIKRCLAEVEDGSHSM